MFRTKVKKLGGIPWSHRLIFGRLRAERPIFVYIVLELVLVLVLALEPELLFALPSRFEHEYEYQHGTSKGTGRLRPICRDSKTTNSFSESPPLKARFFPQFNGLC